MHIELGQTNFSYRTFWHTLTWTVYLPLSNANFSWMDNLGLQIWQGRPPPPSENEWKLLMDNLGLYIFTPPPRLKTFLLMENLQCEGILNPRPRVPRFHCFPAFLISLHIRSMWETICDAWACRSGWKFGANSTEYPYSVIQNTPPPPENWNLARSWDFEYFQLQNTPPPRKIEI